MGEGSRPPAILANVVAVILAGRKAVVTGGGRGIGAAIGRALAAEGAAVLLAARLTDEFRSGACHAGRYEGSLVLAVRPELVREETRRGLPPNPASLTVAMREGKTTFAAAGGPEAYFGDPAAASREEGEATLAALAALLEEAVLAAIGSSRSAVGPR